jgi:hypothetical protein
MLDRNAEFVAERFDQQWRRRGTTGHDALHRCERLATRPQVLQQSQPDGRNAAGHCHPFAVEQAGQTGAIEMTTREHKC